MRFNQMTYLGVLALAVSVGVASAQPGRFPGPRGGEDAVAKAKADLKKAEEALEKAKAELKKAEEGSKARPGGGPGGFGGMGWGRGPGRFGGMGWGRGGPGFGRMGWGGPGGFGRHMGPPHGRGPRGDGPPGHARGKKDDKDKKGPGRPAAGGPGKGTGGDVNARLDRIEKAIEELRQAVRGRGPGGPGGPPMGRGPGPRR